MVKGSKRHYLERWQFFILAIIVGILIFAAISIFISYSGLLLLGFLATYIAVSTLILKKYSVRTIIFLEIILFAYLLIMIFPFSRCSFYENGMSQICTCKGIEKHTFTIYAGSDDSQCLGRITNYECREDSSFRATSQPTPC